MVEISRSTVSDCFESSVTCLKSIALQLFYAVQCNIFNKCNAIYLMKGRSKGGHGATDASNSVSEDDVKTGRNP